MRIQRLVVRMKPIVSMFAAALVGLAFQIVPAQAAVPTRPALYATSQPTASADRFQFNRYDANGRDGRSMAPCTTRFPQRGWGNNQSRQDFSCSTTRQFDHFNRDRGWPSQSWGSGQGYGHDTP